MCSSPGSKIHTLLLPLFYRGGDIPKAAGTVRITHLASTVASLKFRRNPLRNIAVASVEKLLKNHRPGEAKTIAEQSGFLGLFNAHAHPHISFAKLLPVRVIINHLTIGRTAKLESRLGNHSQEFGLYHGFEG